MNSDQIQAYAKGYGIPTHTIHQFLRFAKKQYGGDSDALTGVVKRMIKNYKKYKMENKIMNNIEMALCVLEECGCGGKCDKTKCKCKDKKNKKNKKEAAFGVGNEIEEGEGKSVNCKECGSKVNMNSNYKEGSCCNKTKAKMMLGEGRTKNAMADKAEKVCTCDGGASLDPDDHKKKCPAQKVIDGSSAGDDIDAAEYRKGGR